MFLFHAKNYNEVSAGGKDGGSSLSGITVAGQYRPPGFLSGHAFTHNAPAPGSGAFQFAVPGHCGKASHGSGSHAPLRTALPLLSFSSMATVTALFAAISAALKSATVTREPFHYRFSMLLPALTSENRSRMSASTRHATGPGEQSEKQASLCFIIDNNLLPKHVPYYTFR